MITVAQVRELYVGNTTVTDQLLQKLIDTATARVEALCGQPIRVTSHVVRFEGTSTVYSPVLLYSVPSTLTTLKERLTMSDAQTTITATMTAVNGVKRLYRPEGFFGAEYEATLSSGFSTIPADIQQVCGEMVTQLFLESPLTTGERRFAVDTITRNNSGVMTVATKFSDLLPRWMEALRPYTIVSF